MRSTLPLYDRAIQILEAKQEKKWLSISLIL
jgi:putative SOS response-associated peptidase YedK